METKIINWKKLWLSTFVSGILMTVIAGAWHTFLALTFYNEQANAKHDGIGIIFIAYILLGFLMSLLYSIWKIHFPKLWQAVPFGCIIGALWVFPHELAMVGAHGKLTLSYVFRNGAWHLVEQGIGAWIIGLVFQFSLRRIEQ